MPSWTLTVPKGNTLDACTLLARFSGLSKSRVKETMIKGGVWLQKRGKGKSARLRRATFLPRGGDLLRLHHDPEILARTAQHAQLVADRGHYSVWNKPAGMPSQGTLFADHCSLLHQAKSAFSPRRPALPVHRLDREAKGLVIVAHSPEAAARLSRIFAGGEVEKTYVASVLGRLTQKHGIIDIPLDGRKAATGFRVIKTSEEPSSSRVEVRLFTGRKHQIRRHLAAIGHPILGDPRYGRGNACAAGLQLTAVRLVFTCPFSGKAEWFELDGGE